MRLQPIFGRCVNFTTRGHISPYSQLLSSSPGLLTRFHLGVWHYRHTSNRDKLRRAVAVVIHYAHIKVPITHTGFSILLVAYAVLAAGNVFRDV